MAEKNSVVSSGFKPARALKGRKNQRAERREKELTKPLSNGSVVADISMRSAKPMRRRAHRSDRGFIRRQLGDFQQFCEELAGAYFWAFREDINIEEPERTPAYARNCGAATVTARGLQFYPRGT